MSKVEWNMELGFSQLNQTSQKVHGAWKAFLQMMTTSVNSKCTPTQVVFKYRCYAPRKSAEVLRLEEYYYYGSIKNYVLYTSNCLPKHAYEENNGMNEYMYEMSQKQVDNILVFILIFGVVKS